MRRTPPVVALLFMTPFAACAHGGARGESPDRAVASDSVAPRPRRPRWNADRLTIDEFGGRSWANLYEVVSTLRGNWLNRRGFDTINGDERDVQVLLDGYAIGGAEQLRAQSVEGVVYLQHYVPRSATARWGMGFGKGAIYISTREDTGRRAAVPR
jgi:hypothetical protein